MSATIVFILFIKPLSIPYFQTHLLILKSLSMYKQTDRQTYIRTVNDLVFLAERLNHRSKMICDHSLPTRFLVALLLYYFDSSVVKHTYWHLFTNYI